MTDERLNYGQIHTPYLNLAFLAALYVLIRQTGGEPEDAAVLMTLIGGGLMKIRL